ncbi:hypothetical protein [Enterococcus sp. N249-2]
MFKSEMKFADRLDAGGEYVECDNPDCATAYHFMKDISYSVLQQDRPDGLIIDLSFCSLRCLLQIDPFKEKYGVLADLTHKHTN